MNLPFFLYRRLCRWITCDLRLPFDFRVSLATKYDIGSFHDVFCHPFYWQVFGWMEAPPHLVVDCGANCGHFSILAETCFRVKFGQLPTAYLLVEPNPALAPILYRNLQRAGLRDRATLLPGLLGPKSGTATLWVHPKNYLASGLSPLPGAKPHSVRFIDLLPHLGDRAIDLLKIDIEGGEYDFVRENPDVLARANLVVMEIHAAPEGEREALFAALERAGLEAIAPPLESDGLCLAAWRRCTPTRDRP